MKLSRLPILLALFFFIHNGQCNHTAPATVSGTCEAFKAPGHPIAGKTKKDQRWIDETIARGVGACGWPLPRADAR